MPLVGHGKQTVKCRNFGRRSRLFEMRSVCLANRRFGPVRHGLATSGRPTVNNPGYWHFLTSKQWRLFAERTATLARIIHVASSAVHIALLANKLCLAPLEALCSGRLTTTPFAALRDVPPLLQTLG